MMPMTPSLRRPLLADVALTGAAGILMLAGAPLLDGPLGLPVGLLATAGIVLLAFVTVVAMLARRAHVSVVAVGAVVGVNLLWAAESVAALLLGWLDPTTLGVLFVVAQAVAVMGLAGWQAVAIARARASAPRLA